MNEFDSGFHPSSTSGKRALVLAMNPSIDLEWEVPQVLWEEKNTIESERRWAGGKGINVARWLHQFKCDYQLLAPLGGEVGKELRHLLKEEGMHFRSMAIEQPNRVDVIVTTETGRQMRFNPRGPRLTTVEMESFYREVEKGLSHAACMVLSGSLPRGVSPAAYAHLIKLASRLNVPALLDCDGEALRQAVSARPLLIKPNHHELARWAGEQSLVREDRVLEAAWGLSGETGHWVLVSRGAKRSWLVNGKLRSAYWAQPPPVKPINTVGAGDALLAAVSWQIMRGTPPVEWLRWGIGAGSAATEMPAGKLPETGVVNEKVNQVRVGER